MTFVCLIKYKFIDAFGNGSAGRLIIVLGITWRRVTSFTPPTVLLLEGRSLCPLDRRAEGAAERAWTRWTREKILPLPGILNTISSAARRVA